VIQSGYHHTNDLREESILAVKLVTDSTSYIDEKTQAQLDIQKVHLGVNFPDESFDETAVTYDYFYNKIERDNVIPTSTQPSPAQIYNVFKQIVMRGEEVLGVFLSSKMSGTYDTALSIKKSILEEIPQARIEVMDSKTNCMSMGLQVVEAAIAAQAGKGLEEVLKTAQQVRDRVRFYFTPASLQYLIKGGRIGGASALIGSLLKIRPVLYVNDGMTDVFAKVRGTQRAIQCMLNQLRNDAEHYGLKHLLVHHIHDEKRGQELADYLSQLYQREVPCCSVGPVIGLHVGPGTVGIVYTTER